MSEHLVSFVRAAFAAGYACQWIRGEQRYIFDPNMKPGDPDGAYWAWLVSLGDAGRTLRDAEPAALDKTG